MIGLSTCPDCEILNMNSMRLECFRRFDFTGVLNFYASKNRGLLKPSRPPIFSSRLRCFTPEFPFARRRGVWWGSLFNSVFWASRLCGIAVYSPPTKKKLYNSVQFVACRITPYAVVAAHLLPTGFLHAVIHTV